MGARPKCDWGAIEMPPGCQQEDVALMPPEMPPRCQQEDVAVMLP
jgi:hypothetical protein